MMGTKSFNPNQARDWHGRFSDLASAAGHAADIARALASSLSPLSSFRSHSMDSSYSEESYQRTRDLAKAALGTRSLTPDNLRALRTYDSGAYPVIQKWLRTGIRKETGKGLNLSDVIPPHMENYFLHHLDEAITKAHLPEDTVLFRGLKRSNYKAGEVLTNAGYTSTSLNRKVAQGYTPYGEKGSLFHIYAPKGTNALPVDDTMGNNPVEHQVILPRQSKLKVVHVEKQQMGFHHEFGPPEGEYGGHRIISSRPLMKKVIHAVLLP